MMDQLSARHHQALAAMARLVVARGLARGFLHAFVVPVGLLTVPAQARQNLAGPHKITMMFIYTEQPFPVADGIYLLALEGHPEVAKPP